MKLSVIGIAALATGFSAVVLAADLSQVEPLLITQSQSQVQTQTQQHQTEYLGHGNEKISLNFQDIEVRAVLQLLADVTDVNLVVSDSVQGHITLRLQDVPWDQALELILQSKGLRDRKSVV